MVTVYLKQILCLEKDHISFMFWMLYANIPNFRLFICFSCKMLTHQIKKNYPGNDLYSPDALYPCHS